MNQTKIKLPVRVGSRRDASIIFDAHGFEVKSDTIVAVLNDGESYRKVLEEIERVADDNSLAPLGRIVAITKAALASTTKERGEAEGPWTLHWVGTAGDFQITARDLLFSGKVSGPNDAKTIGRLIVAAVNAYTLASPTKEREQPEGPHYLLVEQLRLCSGMALSSPNKNTYLNDAARTMLAQAADEIDRLRAASPAITPDALDALDHAQLLNVAKQMSKLLKDWRAEAERLQTKPDAQVAALRTLVEERAAELRPVKNHPDKILFVEDELWLERAEAALSPSSGGSWQPIETAPMNETVLVCNPSEGRIPVVAKRRVTGWINVGAVPVGRTSQDYKLDPLPTYWQPLPASPSSSTEPGGKP